MNATSPCPPAIAGPTPKTHGKLVQASGSLIPAPIPTAPIMQKSAPQRHDVTDPRIKASGLRPSPTRRVFGRRWLGAPVGWRP